MKQSAMAQAGCFGKLPARGDFLLRGLPRAFADPWHEWLIDGLQASRDVLGDGWLDRYLNAPIWRFALDAGVCGPRAVAGVLMPSVDKAGRQFPLTLAALLASGETACGIGLEGAWFDAAEELALSALTDELDVEAFVASVAAMPPPPVRQAIPQPAASARWRTLGGAGIAEQGFTSAGLPPASSFAGFLVGEGV